MKKIGIIMGSDSDLGVVEGAIDTLKKFGAEYSDEFISNSQKLLERIG